MSVAYFEKISKYADVNLPMPDRKTSGSAGFDFAVAEDIVVPSYQKLTNLMNVASKAMYDPSDIFNLFFDEKVAKEAFRPRTLEEIADLTKTANARPTLVPTGMKCYLPQDYYLELSVRSSCPLKHWILLANGVGVIDADYYNNPDNEGHIYFQVINLSPYDILLKKGDVIGQGIIKSYFVTIDDKAVATRTGGFGSTSK